MSLHTSLVRRPTPSRPRVRLPQKVRGRAPAGSSASGSANSCQRRFASLCWKTSGSETTSAGRCSTAERPMELRKELVLLIEAHEVLDTRKGLLVDAGGSSSALAESFHGLCASRVGATARTLARAGCDRLARRWADHELVLAGREDAGVGREAVQRTVGHLERRDRR